MAYGSRASTIARARAWLRRFGRRARSVVWTSRRTPARNEPKTAATTADQPETAAPSEPTLTSRLQRFAWVGSADAPQLRIEGSAWRPGGDPTGSEVSAVTLEIAGDSIPLTVHPVSSAAINDHARTPTADRSGAGFVATLSADQLLARIPAGELVQLQGRLQITVTDRDGQLSGGFAERSERGSAGQLHSCGIGDGCLVRPEWDPSRGVVLVIARRAVVADRIGFTATRLEAVLTNRGDLDLVRAELRNADRVHPLSLQRSSDRVVVSGELSALLTDVPDTGTQRWYLRVVDDQKRSRHVHWEGTLDQSLHRPSPADPRLAVRYAPGGVIRIDVQPVRLAAEDIRIEDSANGRTGSRLTIAGECHGVPADAQNWRLVGGRRRLRPSAVELQGGRFSATFDLTDTPEWGGRPMPLPSGNYALLVRCPGAGDQGRDVRAEIEPRLARELPLALTTAGNKITVVRTPNGRLSLVVGPPLPDGALSPYSRRRLEVLHSRPDELTDAALFNSFNGRAANDNTRAVHDELARRAPDLRRLWTVADLSVEVPDGAEPVIFWSQEWWQALSTSRYVVTNCWMPKAFQRHEDQQVLQTWHGTPLKLLGFDRLGTKRGAGYRTKTEREVAQWRYLIAQNPFSADVFRSAYGYRGEVLEIGYPRNDILSTADCEFGRTVRKHLGIGAAELVVLYTPTWREGAGKIFSELDLDAMQRALGDAGRLLVRGHVNTVGHGGPLQGPRLLDVTMYPDLAALYLISDVMITDYSSTMFDFSITGKPMIFFVPDLDEYAGRRRGTYFDLAAEAPGPLLRRSSDVAAALQQLDRLPDRYAERYAAWQQRYNPYDDGHASQRAVDALLDR